VNGTGAASMSTTIEPTVRDATRYDLPAIVEIYNQSVAAGWSTADTEPIEIESRIEWFEHHDPERRPLWVAELDDRVVAWISLTSWYEGRPAYDATAEVSTYIATDYHRRGMGLFLKQRMIEACPGLGVTTMLSLHFDHNEGTGRINEKLGFERMGHLEEIALIAGQPRGLVISGLRIPAPR